MFDTRIEILEYIEDRDEYNDRSKSLQVVTVCYAQCTENGGRENLYAGRIVHENEVVYTTRWQDGLKAGQMIRDDGYLRKIVSIHEEGRRWRMHLKCTKSDGHTVPDESCIANVNRLLTGSVTQFKSECL